MILRAAWVLPVVGPPIRDGFVRLAGDSIVQIGPAASLDRQADILDLGAAILMPGLINPHTHLELTGYAGRLAPAPFWEWVLRLVELRRAPGRVPRETQAAVAGAWASLRAGVTCVGDISRENVSWRALKPLPIRKVCFAELLSLADAPPRNPVELRRAVLEIEEDALLTAGVTPHAPYTVPQADICAAIRLAAELERPWCTHWAETREELAFLAGRNDELPRFMYGLLEQCGVRSPHCGPLDYLAACTAGARPGLLAHVNYVTDDEIARLAKSGHTVAYCPRAHRFFGHPEHPFARLIAAGVPVVIGTDSAASNESLSILEELRHLRRHVPGTPAEDVLLRMATLDAARSLGLDGQIGSLAPGKQADFVAFACPRAATEPAAVVIESAPPALAVWVAGQRVSFPAR